MLDLYALMGRYTADWHVMMGTSVMVIIPVQIAFLLGQRYFVEGIRMTGSKGQCNLSRVGCGAYTRLPRAEVPAIANVW